MLEAVTGGPQTIGACSGQPTEDEAGVVRACGGDTGGPRAAPGEKREHGHISVS